MLQVSGFGRFRWRFLRDSEAIPKGFSRDSEGFPGDSLGVPGGPWAVLGAPGWSSGWPRGLPGRPRGDSGRHQFLLYVKQNIDGSEKKWL